MCIGTLLPSRHTGQVIGTLGTYWDRRYRPIERDLRNLDILARQAADMLERHAAVALLRESEQRFRAFVAASSDVIFRVSPDWTEMRKLDDGSAVVDTSKPHEAWLGGRIPPEDQPRVSAAIEQAIASRQMFELEHRVIRPDGSLAWTHSRALPIVRHDGGVVEWFGAAKDITARKHAEEALQAQSEQLREADRRKDEFLATLAHELRNPLAPVRHATEVLKLVDEPETREQMQDILERSVAHMVRLVDDLLDVSRITRGKIQLRRRRVSLAPLLSEVVDSLRSSVDAAQHELTLRTPSDPVVVDADEVRLSQVFTNLINNAIKYTPADGFGRIGVSLRVQQERASVTVSDNGLGIPPSMFERVFEPFTQIDRTLEQTQGGLGIGLAITRRLVELHGGTVHLESEGVPGRGSRFTVHLPLTAAATTSRPAAVHRARAVARRRVLVVDDNLNSAEALATFFRAMGHETRIGRDGVEALALAAEFRPDIAILDIGMPRMNGYDACRRIREAPWGRAIFLVAHTGWGQEEDRDRVRRAGFDEHLVKPADVTSLLELLQRVGAEGIRA